MRLRALRRALDYTQADIAQILHCKTNTYCQYERANRNVPIDVLKILAEFYGTSIDFLVEFTDIQSPYPRKK